jgi:valyl-tRNA synthetase
MGMEGKVWMDHITTVEKAGFAVRIGPHQLYNGDDYYRSVISVFVELHKKGSIYRGKRMINWDVRAKTALSDEEVIR